MTPAPVTTWSLWSLVDTSVGAGVSSGQCDQLIMGDVADGSVAEEAVLPDHTMPH